MPMTMSSHLARLRGHRLILGFVSVVLVAGGAFAGFGLTQRLSNQPSRDAIGGPFALTAGNGQQMTDHDFSGKWLLMYFGYTHCPDICPTTLAEISETLNLLGAQAAQVQPLFITIDPERDTPDAVATFVNSFDARIIGLTGTPAQIAAVAKEYHVYYAKSTSNTVSNTVAESSGTDSQSYAMDHTAFVYVMAPNGKYVTLFSPLQGQTPDAMAAKLHDLMSGTQPG
jgi:protein SCO1